MTVVRPFSILPLLFVSGLASAETLATSSEDDPPPLPPNTAAAPAMTGMMNLDKRPRLRLEGGFGPRFGSQFIDGRDVGTVSPVHVDLGLRTPSWLLYGEYSLMSFTWPTSPASLSGQGANASAVTGLMQETSVNARYAIGHAGEKDLDSNVWAEAGVGLQHVTWDAGGVWTRPELAFGMGLSMFGLGDARHGGMSAGFRVTLARRTNASGPPTCAGPCDMATAPSGWDRSITFDLTMLFGT